MKFYDCATAPSPKRVRMFIAEKDLEAQGVQIPVVQIDLANREQHSEAFGKINPYRTVPALALEDGTVLTSTAGICRYLEARFPEPPLLGASPEQQGLIADLDWHIEQEGFLAVGESFRNRAKSFKHNALPGSQEHAQIPELVDRGRSRAEYFLKWLNEHLSSREFIAGSHFSVADITAFVTIEFAAWIKLPVPDDHQHTKRWLTLLGERNSATA